jgi:hypothetical protein
MYILARSRGRHGGYAMLGLLHILGLAILLLIPKIENADPMDSRAVAGSRCPHCDSVVGVARRDFGKIIECISCRKAFLAARPSTEPSRIAAGHGGPLRNEPSDHHFR